MAGTPPNAASTQAAPNGSAKPIPNKYAAPASPLGRVPAPNGLAPRAAAPKPASRANRRRRGTPWLTFSAFVLTMVWFGVVGFYVIKAGGFTSFLESSGAAAVIAVTGLMMAPAALFWMVFAYIKRASDVESALEPLLRQLSLVTGQGGVAETRVRRFNDALAEQLTLLKETSSVSTKTAQSALTILTAERSTLEESQSGFAQQINALVDTMRQQSAQLEALVETGHQQMGNITSLARETSSTVATETYSAEQRLTALLDSVTGKFGASLTQLDRDQQETLNNYATLSNSVSETLKGDAVEIETRLSALVNAIDTTLDAVDRVAGDRLDAALETTATIGTRETKLRDDAAAASSALEDSAAAIADATTRFRESASASRTEAERTLQSLSEQTRLLDSHATATTDKLTGTRDLIAQAAAALDIAAARLADSGSSTSEALELRIAGLSDAATALDTTAQRIAGQLDQQLTGYGDKQSLVSQAYATLLDRLRSESASISHAAEKLGADADNSATRVRGAIDELAKTTSHSLDSYGAIAGKADAQSAAVAETFNGAIDRYAGTARQLNVAAAELQTLAQRCEDTLVQMDTTLTDRAGLLDDVSTRMATTSRSIKDDSTGLVTTLQDLSSRLETVRAAAIEASDQTVLRLTDVASAAGRNLSGLEQLATGALARLEVAGSEIGRQQVLIATQVDAVQNKLSGLSNELSTRIGGVLGQVEQSSQKAGALIEGFLAGTQSLAPALQSVAEEATSVALSASGAINAETQRFGDRIAAEKARWGALTDEQSRAFADTIAELQAQMNALRDVNSELEAGSTRAAATLHSHTHAVGTFDSQLTASLGQHTGQLDSVRTEIEKIVDYLQRQTLTLSTVTQQALSGVREATGEFGDQARTLGELSRQTESQIVSAAERMGEAKTVTGETRESVYALREEIERVVERLMQQTRQLDGARENSRHAAEELAAQSGSAITQLGNLTSGLDTALERATLARAGAFVQLDDVAGRIAGETQVLADTIDALTARAGIAGEAITAAGRDADLKLQAQLEQTLAMLQAKLDVATQDVAQLGTKATESAGIAAASLRGQVADQLASIEAQTEQTLSQIDIRTQQTTVAIGRAAGTLAESGEAITAQLDRALGQLGATDAALGQLSDHASTLRRSLVEDSETMITALDRVTQDLTSRIALLQTTNEAGLDRAAQDTEALQALLAEATAKLQDSALHLRDVSQSAGGTLTTIGAQLENQTDLVRETGAELAELSRDALGTETQLTGRLGQLMTQVARTRGDLAALDLQLVDQSARLSAQQGEALATLSQTLTSLDQVSGRIVATGADAVDSASAAQVHYAALARDAEQVVAQHAPAFAAAAERSAAALSDYASGSETVARRLEAQQQQLVGMFSALRSEGTASAETLSALGDRITAVELAASTATQAALRQLGDAGNTIVAGIGSVTGAAEAAASTLSLQAETLAEQAGAIGQAARTATSDTESAITALHSQGAAAHGLLSGQLDTLLSQVSQAQRGFDASGAQLTQQGTAAARLLDQVSGTFEAMLGTAQATILQLQQEMEGFTTATATALDASGQQLDTRGQSFVEFGRRLETLVDSLNAGTASSLGQLRQVTQQLEVAQSSSAEIVTLTSGRLTDAAGTLEARQDAMARSADAALQRLREVNVEAVSAFAANQDSLSTATDATLQQLRTAGDEAAAVLARTQDAIAHHTGTLVSQVRSAANDAANTLLDSADGMVRAADGKLQQLRTAGDDAVAAFLATQDTITQNADALVAQVRDASGEVTAALTGTSDATLRQLRAIGDEASAVLANTQDGLAQQAEHLVAQVRTASSELTTALAGSSDATLRQLRAAGDEANALLAHTQESLTEQAGSLVAQLREASSEVTATLAGSSDTTLRQLRAAGDEAGAMLTRTQDGLAQQADNLIAQVREASSDATAALAGTGDATLRQLRAVGDEAGAVLARTQDELAQQTDSLVAQVRTAASEATAALADTSDATLRQLRAVGDEADAVLARTQDGLAKQAGSLVAQVREASSEATGTFANTAEAMARMAGGTLQQLLAAGEQAVSAFTATQDGLAETAAELVQQVRSAGSDAVAAFAGSADDIARAANTARAQTREAVAEADQAAAALARLEAHGLSLRNSLAGGLDAEAAALEHSLGRAQQALEGAAEAFVRQQADALETMAAFETRTDSSLQGMQQVNAAWQARQAAMTKDGTQVLQETARIFESFSQLRDTLDGQVQGLMQQLNGAVAQSGTQVSAISVLTDSQAELRTQTDKAVQSLAAAARRVAETSSDAKADLDDVTNRYNGLQGLTTHALHDQLGELRSLIDSATGLMGDLSRQLETQTAAVTDAGSALAHVSGSVNDNTAAALSRLQTLNQRLEAAKLSATLATEEAARRVADILAQVDSDDDLDSATQKAS